MANKKPKKKLTSLIRRKQTSDKLKPIERAKRLVKGDEGNGQSKSPVRITNDTVAKHREEVLSGARRFIYPLQHSKHRIAIISGAIVGAIIFGLFVLSWFLLYRQQSTSDFAYRITQIVPFPVARVDGDFVRYEEYLFELRQNIHYLTNQENADFDSEEGKNQLSELRRQAMERTIDRAIMLKMAKEHNIEVTGQEVEEQIDLIRSQSGVGEGTKTLEDTLKDFYGWNLSDLRRVIRTQITSRKLMSQLNTDVRAEAQSVLEDIKNGEDFAKAAEEHSDDELSAGRGGDLEFVFRSNTELPPQLVERAFSLAPDEVADELVESLFGFHIVKNLEYRNPDEARIAHILFRYEDIQTFIDQRQQELETSTYIDVGAEQEAVPAENQTEAEA